MNLYGFSQNISVGLQGGLFSAQSNVTENYFFGGTNISYDRSHFSSEISANYLNFGANGPLIEYMASAGFCTLQQKTLSFDLRFGLLFIDSKDSHKTNPIYYSQVKPALKTGFNYRVSKTQPLIIKAFMEANLLEASSGRVLSNTGCLKFSLGVNYLLIRKKEVLPTPN
ncbi:MAG: hypothetical protein H0W61_11175 [Bacteroidetes bacterium]|nr:hypothetical protein [Bacteroidota bacterium]